MELEDKIRKIRKDIENLNRSKVEAEYKLESAKKACVTALGQLKTQFNIETLDEAYALLKDNEEKITKSLKDIETMLGNR